MATDEKTVEVPANNGTPGTTASSNHANATEYAVEGYIVSADCRNGPGKVTLSVSKTLMHFRFTDFAALGVVSTAKLNAGDPPACANWKGRRARLYFYKLKSKEYMGDLDTIQFF